MLRAAIAERLGAVGLELHPDKTKIVFCKDANRRGHAEHTSFDFLGYTFRGRLARGRHGYFVSFQPAMSTQGEEGERPADQSLAPQPSQRHGPVRPRRGDQPPGARLDQLLRGLLPLRVVLPRTAHQRAPRSVGHAEVQTTARQAVTGMGMAGSGSPAQPPTLRPLAACPTHPGPACGSRMTGDCHVRFCESGRGRLPPATHPIGAAGNDGGHTNDRR